MTTPTLFDAPQAGLVRHSDPVTSVAAARSLTPGRTERRILDAFRVLSCAWPRQGFTDDELVDLILPALHPPTVKSARSRLSKAGLLADSGVTRPSNRGRQSVVWVLA